VRITKDITSLFNKKLEIMKTPKNEEVEIKKYNNMLRPSIDSFIHAYKGLDFSISNMFIKFYAMFENVLSFDFISKVKEKIVLKKIYKQSQKNKKLKIKNTVRSYKTAFNRFNKEPTLYETDKDGVRRRGEITLQKNRKQNKNL